MDNLLKLYDEYKAKKEESDRLDELVTNGAYELEAEWDAAYNDYWLLREALVQELMKVTNSTREVVNRMLASEKLDAIFQKAV